MERRGWEASGLSELGNSGVADTVDRHDVLKGPPSPPIAAALGRYGNDLLALGLGEPALLGHGQKERGSICAAPLSPSLGTDRIVVIRDVLLL